MCSNGDPGILEMPELWEESHQGVLQAWSEGNLRRHPGVFQTAHLDPSRVQQMSS